MKFQLLLCLLPLLAFAEGKKENNPYLDERFIVIELHGFTHHGESGYQFLTVRKNEIPIFEGYMEYKPSLGKSGAIYLFEENEFLLQARLAYDSDKEAIKIQKKISKDKGRFIEIAYSSGKLKITQQDEPFLYL